MTFFTVNQVSTSLRIPKDTLRYYDKIKLVCPIRGENRYRFYTKHDLIDLQYIEVMKHAGFTLIEIQKVLLNKRSGNCENLADTMRLLETKKDELTQKIARYRSIIELISEAETVLHAKRTPVDSTRVNEMIQRTFYHLKGETHEK